MNSARSCYLAARALGYLQVGNFASALTDLQKAREGLPRREDVLNNLIYAQYKLDKPLDELLAQPHTSSPQLLIGLARLFKSARQYAEVEAICERLLSLEGHKLPAKGEHYGLQLQLVSAMLSRPVDKPKAELIRKRMSVLERNEEYGNVKSKFEMKLVLAKAKRLVLDSNDEEALRMLIEAFDREKRAKGNPAEVYHVLCFNIATLYYKQGDFSEALCFVEYALRQRPDKRSYLKLQMYALGFEKEYASAWVIAQKIEFQKESRTLYSFLQDQQ